MTPHAVSDTCPCFACVMAGKTYCARMRGCLLRDHHAGECAGRLRFVRLFAGEVKRRAVQWMRGDGR